MVGWSRIRCLAAICVMAAAGMLAGCNRNQGGGKVTARLAKVRQEQRGDVHEMVFDVVLENAGPTNRPVRVLVYLYREGAEEPGLLWPRGARQANLSPDGHLAVRDPSQGAQTVVPAGGTAKLENKSVVLTPGAPPLDRFRTLIYSPDGTLLFDHTLRAKR
jgi:hypothetical protein